MTTDLLLEIMFMIELWCLKIYFRMVSCEETLGHSKTCVWVVGLSLVISSSVHYEYQIDNSLLPWLSFATMEERPLLADAKER
jgi:hypothetical protein